MKSSKKIEFEAKYETWIKYVNDALSTVITEKETPAKNIYSAMRYSLMAGGKRIRPVLSLAVCEMLDGNIMDILPYACAIEMIHTYSLIHDDLPAMDNDDYRRGKPTNHKIYGEAKAILAGDGLLTYAFELMTKSILHALNNNGIDMGGLEKRVRAVNYIARASGVSGMIGGQVIDIESVERIIEPEVLEFMNRCKTGALIKAAVMAPVIITGLDKDSMDCLEKYSDNIGLAFQVKDDILDAEGNLELLGKRTGRDFQEKRSTYVTLYGLCEAKNRLDYLIHDGITALDKFGGRADFLRNLALYIKKRKN
jgi:geranylgeranyl diphosphate synthase type II